MGKKGMIALMMLMVTIMAVIFVHIMWINRPINTSSGALTDVEETAAVPLLPSP
ncbi:MAG: hypothetical protein J5685_08810 [Clostridiales bacterium]|nr:hypothetical protein [Clostridiales bacterium]